MSHCLAGMAIGVLPLLALALADPAAFYFDTFTYHARRYPGTGWVKDPLQKLAVVWHVFASPAVPWPARLDASGLQLLPLLGFSVLSLRRVTREASAPWLVLAVLLGLVALLPSPVHAQYFCVLVPPLTVTALLGWTHSTRALRRFGVVCALVSVASSLPLLHGTFKTQPWQRPTAVDEVGRAVARVTTPDDIIAAHWPAYLVSSDRTVLPDAQSEFVRLAGFLSTPAEHERFKLYTEESMAAELRSGAVRVFVAGHYFVPWTSSVVVEDGWQQAAAPPGVTVWVR